MALLSWWINIFGIVISAVGTSLVFLGTPKDSTGHTVLQNSYVTRDEFEKDLKKMRKRGKLSKWFCSTSCCPNPNLSIIKLVSNFEQGLANIIFSRINRP